MPKWLTWLVGPMIDKSLTRKMISRNIGLPFRADNSKGIRELGLSYRPVEETVIDFFRQMVDSGVFDLP
jgi:dihydroflavonol-4-reductase